MYNQPDVSEVCKSKARMELYRKILNNVVYNIYDIENNHIELKSGLETQYRIEVIDNSTNGEPIWGFADEWHSVAEVEAVLQNALKQPEIEMARIQVITTRTTNWKTI